MVRGDNRLRLAEEPGSDPWPEAHRSGGLSTTDARIKWRCAIGKKISELKAYRAEKLM